MGEYILRGNEEVGFGIVYGSLHIPLDVINIDFLEYSKKVNTAKIEDVLPQGKLEELFNLSE